MLQLGRSFNLLFYMFSGWLITELGLRARSGEWPWLVLS
jgi:hypothetical protein